MKKVNKAPQFYLNWSNKIERNKEAVKKVKQKIENVAGSV
jgi:hypothetical protein